MTDTGDDPMPMTLEQHQQRRTAEQARRQGMTLIEIMIVITIIAMILGGVSVAVLPQLSKARVKATRADAQNLKSAISLYIGDNPRACPTVDDLVNERYLDGTKRTTDAWDTPFQITCEGGDIFVVSAGEDGVFDTEDDIQ
ncbi:MAG: type II secretion system protein GspG [Myxococcota bacterium]